MRSDRPCAVVRVGAAVGAVALAVAAFSVAFVAPAGAQPDDDLADDLAEISLMYPIHNGFQVYWHPPYKSGVTDYDIEWREYDDSSSTWGQWHERDHTGTATYTLLTGLTARRKYQVRVRYWIGGRYSPWTTSAGHGLNTAWAQNYEDRGLPDPPVWPTITQSAGRLTVSWVDPGTGNNSVDITGYRVQWSTPSEEFAGPLLPATATSYDIPGLVANTEYHVAVTACAADDGRWTHSPNARVKNAPQTPPRSSLPTLTLSASPASVTEGPDAKVTVTARLDNAATPSSAGGMEVTLIAAAGSTATATDDYTLPAAFTIDWCHASADAEIAIVDDDIVEGQELANLGASTTPSGTTVNGTSITIDDDDPNDRVINNPPDDDPPDDNPPDDDLLGGDPDDTTERDVSTTRVGGPDRTTTSVDVAEEYRRRIEASGGEVDTVIVATSRKFPDGLAASSLAGTVHAPILLTDRDRLSEEVASFIERHSISRVYIMGGHEAVSFGVERSLEALEPVESLIRLGGVDRYETSMLIAREVGVPRHFCNRTWRTVLLATGTKFPDALAAAPVAAVGPHPLLLTRPDALPPSVRDHLRSYAGYGWIDEVLVVGGQDAISSDVVRAIVDMGVRVTRVGGADRYETATLLAEHVVFPASPAPDRCLGNGHLGVAIGTTFADALVAGPLLAFVQGPTLLVEPADQIPAAVAAYLPRFVHDSDSLELLAIGGPAVLTDRLIERLKARATR
ncbi:cell wall-binding repeat-containing protein [Candidatus Poriferisodalis sp.]|uniref:cell wall-binding repeat-containing protein n=1 Tax=Candidatus Poriferisodalis sp. TaxID=3101277 RepID=UPI003B027579